MGFDLGLVIRIPCRVICLQSLLSVWRQVKNGRLFLTTTEVPPSSDWCSKREIQVVAATTQRLFPRRQNRIRIDPGVERRFLSPWDCPRKSEEQHDLCFRQGAPPPPRHSIQSS